MTAIELDPEPTPPSKLKFKDLRDRSLFNYRRDDDQPTGPVIGSLGDHVSKEHNGTYDLVLCNPPWTSLKTKRKAANESVGRPLQEERLLLKERFKALATEYTRVSGDVLLRRGLKDLALKYQNPDNVPDLPFLWRSTEWCRTGGRIGMVLPGRLLFKQEPVPRLARETLFRSLAVNGILDCSNLSDTNVWRNMNQPFLLLFAQNCVPNPDHQLRIVTPHYDFALNRKGEIRIDSKSAELVSTYAAFTEPWIWKTLAVGTSLDVEVTRKIKLNSHEALFDYWTKYLKLSTSKGYSVDEEGQQDASHLHDLKDLADTSVFRFEVHTEQLPMFSRSTVGRPRERKVYCKPLVLVKGFPGMRRHEGWALLSLNDVAFKKNYYGYSGAGHPNGEELVRYLQLFVHSYLWMHIALMTSPKLGVERREFYKADLDSCPFISLEALTSEQRATIWRLSRQLNAADSGVTVGDTIFDEIDLFFTGLYGLSKQDAEVIRDTIETALPYNETRQRACQLPSREERKRFAARLESSLQPFLRKLGKEVNVEVWQEPGCSAPKAPYSVILVGTKAQPLIFDGKMFRDDVLPLADESGASLVIHDADAGLVVAVLNQYRYWTPSRARLCAGEILLHHMTVFER